MPIDRVRIPAIGGTSSSIRMRAGLYVEHTWHHASTHTQGEAARGSQRFGINDFLTLATDRPARPALIVALSEMFREARQA